MIKILHSADWHLDAPMAGEQDLRRALLQVPGKVAAACRAEKCDLLLLSGDLFDGRPSPEGVHALKLALQEVEVPVFISPGNHDFVTPDSPWLTESWPDNVHIFTAPAIESVAIETLDCRIYGAGFCSMDCGPLLENFRTEGAERWHIAVLHGDPTQKNSPYNPITQAQVAASGLSYIALGHIHKEGILRAKGSLCAWPGCPMGRGFDETGEKGVLVVTLEEQADARFLPLDTPRFYDWQTEILTDAQTAVAALLPAVAGDDHYRITLTGEAEKPDLAALTARFAQYAHLELRDYTVPATDLWACIHDDSLEGVYFKMLHDAMEGQDEQTRDRVLLAAKISRRLLDGREVQLP